MYVELKEAEASFRDRCRAFADEVVAPAVDRCDRENRFAGEVHDEAHRLGLLNVCFPRALGGGGLSHQAMAEGGYELARHCPAIAFTLGFSHGALRPVMYAGTEAQKRRFVGEHLKAHRGYTGLALTEEETAGSNLMQVATRADRTGDGWVLRGRKVMVGMGTEAQLYLVLADTRERGRRLGLTFFAVPRTDRVEVGENTDKLGFRAVPTPAVAFHDVPLDDLHRIGPVGAAEPILLDTLDFIRFGGGIVILGAVEGALADAVGWLEERRIAGGQTLLSTSHVQLAIGQAYAELQSLRLLLRRVAALLDRGVPATEETRTLKLLSSQLAIRATQQLRQMYGWRGIDGAYAIQKRFRDAQQTTIFEGASEVLQRQLAASYLARARRSPRHRDQTLPMG